MQKARKLGILNLPKLSGTLFLDEIANLPLTIQVNPTGAYRISLILTFRKWKNVTTDVRIIVASNVVLGKDEIQAGRFRADLFHRLNEFKTISCVT